MVSIMEIMQFCRLCLVKEQVNVPIFDEQEDIRQICEKITSCLPVKVSKEDELPKKICDGCLYKLELQYQFYNSTANAEKQLLTWLEQAKMDSKTSSSEITTSQTTVKQEKVEPIESTNEITEITEITTDPQSYMQQYQTDFQYKDSQVSNADIDANVSSNSDEPLAKRARRRRQASKPIPREVIESSDENDAGDSMMEMTVTKTEEESESDNEENVDDPEPAKYAAAGEDTEQPGPSGLGKGGTDAPYQGMLELSTSFQLEKDLKTEIIKQEELNYSEDKSFLLCLCVACNQFFNSEDLLNAHKASVHFSENLSDNVDTNPTNDQSYRCDVCAEFYTQESDLIKHRRVHNKRYNCDICTLTFSHASSLLRHRRTHTGEKLYCCNVCSKCFSSKSSLTNHMNIHTGNKPYKCDDCSAAFSQLTTLHRHKRIHTGEKPYGCKVCGKSFSYTWTLANHMNTHTEDKPYKCNICPRTFSQRNSLRLHKRTHTGEKPYVCETCGKCFVRKSIMTKHERTHAANKNI